MSGVRIQIFKKRLHMNTLLTSFQNTQKNKFQHLHDNRVFRVVPKVIIVFVFVFEQTTGKKTKFFNLLYQAWET